MPNLKEYQMTELEFVRLNAFAEVLHDMEMKSSILWKQIGDRLGFDYRTARPVPGKPPMFLQAEPLQKLGVLPSEEKKIK
jgi:hypothetical protein